MNINWGTGVITVYKTDSFMTFTGGSIYNMDTNAFRLALKDAEDDAVGMVYSDTHRHNTTVLLGGIEYARIVEILPPYTITFDDTGGGWVCNLIGSNNNILDRANLTTVQIRSNNSAGLVQTQEIQHSIFGGGVTIDTDNGVAGTIYPAGTPLQPVNNVADARTIADYRGFKTFFVRGDLTLGTGDDVSGMMLVGENASRSYINIQSPANTAAVEIKECTLTGVLDGGTIIRSCYVFDLAYVNGFLHQCEIAGTITLGGNQPAHIMNCYSNINATEINMGGTGNSLNMQQSSGHYLITNKTGSDAVSINLTSGEIVLDATVTNISNIDIHGVGSVTNNTGMTLDSPGLLCGECIGLAVMDQAQTTPIHSDIRKVNNLAVTGSGTESDPWGPV